MVYQKRRSTTLEKAQERLRGLQAVHPELNLGNGLSLQDYANLLADADIRLQAHNQALAEADRTRIEFAQTEATVSALSSRILSAVAAMYGRDSKEYEMAGGKIRSSKRITKPAAEPIVQPVQAPMKAAAIPVSTGMVMNGAKS